MKFSKTETDGEYEKKKVRKQKEWNSTGLIKQKNWEQITNELEIWEMCHHRVTQCPWAPFSGPACFLFLLR